MNKKTIIATILALVMSFACLSGCGQGASANSGTELAAGGILVLSVNPEIAVEYDENGVVTGVIARNDDALAIINSCEDLIGKQTRDAVTNLVSAIGEAGYFVEEIDGEQRQITIEIEAGSKLPYNEFLNEVISDIRDCVDTNNWSVPMDIKNESDYGITDYVDTDYGPNNDGVTDYDDTDYGPNNDGVTDYIDTDYGPNSDGVTDYDDTDYGPNSDGVTDYIDTDYGPNSDGVTDYIDTDYGPNSDGVTDYDDGNSDYKAPTVVTPPPTSSNTDYDDGHSDYDNGNTDYDDGNSDYDDSSDYGNSDYDD